MCRTAKPPNELKLIPILSVSNCYCVAIDCDFEIFTKNRESPCQVNANVLWLNASFSFQIAQDDTRTFGEVGFVILQGSRVIRLGQSRLLLYFSDIHHERRTPQFFSGLRISFNRA